MEKKYSSMIVMFQSHFLLKFQNELSSSKQWEQLYDFKWIDEIFLNIKIKITKKN